MDATSRVVRGTAVYTAAAILQRAALFLLLPFFTRVLTPTEFGHVGVLTSLAAALSVLVGLGLETAIFRGYISSAGDPRSAHQFVNTVGGFAIVVPLVLAAACAVILAPSVSSAFGVPADALRLAFIGAGASASATLVPLALLRAQERLGNYLQLTALQVGVTPVLTIVLVAVFDWAVTGWMLAYALGSVLLLVRGLGLLGHPWAFDFNSRLLIGALAFGLPLVPHALSHWGLSVSDRAILAAFVSGPQVGAYYVAYLFSLPISLVAIALSQATQPLFAEAAKKGTALLQPLTTAHTVATFLVAVSVAVLGPPICLNFLPFAYHSSAPLIPWLALGTFFFGLYLAPMAAIALVAGRTHRVWIITVGAAALNVGLNLAFVPSVGTMAAAVNTTIGYGVLLIGVFLYMRRVCNPPLPYDGARIAVGVLAIGVPAFVAAQLTASDTLLGIALPALALLVSTTLLLVGPYKREATAAVRAMRPSRAGSVA